MTDVKDAGRCELGAVLLEIHQGARLPTGSKASDKDGEAFELLCRTECFVDRERFGNAMMNSVIG